MQADENLKQAWKLLGEKTGYYHGVNLKGEPVPNPDFGAHHLVYVEGESHLKLEQERFGKNGKFYVGPYIPEIEKYSPPFHILEWVFYLLHKPSGTLVLQSPTTEIVTYLMKNTQEFVINDFKLNEEELNAFDSGASKLNERNIFFSDNIEVLFCSNAGDEGKSAGIPSKSEKGKYYGIDIQNPLEFIDGNLIFNPAIDLYCACGHHRYSKKKYTDPSKKKPVLSKRTIEICHHLDTALEAMSLLGPFFKNNRIKNPKTKKGPAFSGLNQY